MKAFGHEGDRTGFLFFEIAFGDVNNFSICTHDFNGSVVRALQDAGVFIAGFGGDDGSCITDSDVGRRLQNRIDQSGSSEFVADGVKIRSGFAAGAVDRVTL